ncbi:MAG: hypothetical protein A2036_01185 [Omnitrophica bacterium GWA2_50_21]|nr:MAG: hypothetical protein A2036_01185 [Omnitrophica bacterium GWA2_50_21]
MFLRKKIADWVTLKTGVLIIGAIGLCGCSSLPQSKEIFGSFLDDKKAFFVILNPIEKSDAGLRVSLAFKSLDTWNNKYGSSWGRFEIKLLDKNGMLLYVITNKELTGHDEETTEIITVPFSKSSIVNLSRAVYDKTKSCDFSFTFPDAKFLIMFAQNSAGSLRGRQ